MRASAKNLRRRSQAPTLELRLSEFSSWEHFHRSNTCWGDDCPAYCWPSLGLGNTAGDRILEGDVWRALKIEAIRRGLMIPTPTVASLWGSEMPDILVYLVVCMCVVFVVYIVV